MKLNHLAVVAVSSLVLVACIPGMTPKKSPSSGGMYEDTTKTNTGTKTIMLTEQNDLGQSGEAVISKDTTGMAVVTITMTGGTFTAPQPAHIHVGSCPTPGAVKYPLTNLVSGKSVTKLDVTYDTLVASTEKMALNIHKSAAESSVYTACGDLY
jgi:hypothetical protein